MRYVTYALTPTRGYFDQGAERLRERGITFESIQNIDQLTDETIITQKVIRGERTAVQSALEETGPTVVDYQLTNDGETTILQLHYRPSDLTRELLAIHRRHAVLLNYPLEYTGPENRSLRVSEIGREEALRRVIEETQAIVDVEIERLGNYDPSEEQPFTALTARQREVLRVAVREGYYEEPRQVTYGTSLPGSIVPRGLSANTSAGSKPGSCRRSSLATTGRPKPTVSGARHRPARLDNRLRSWRLQGPTVESVVLASRPCATVYSLGSR
ncbi:helix-turn-helix domain-containing protein [Natrinema sp. SYSU A 869]|uniref:helix-turn-helix domain-containing protein n=1 Tax=Natrinema sp. SYSU A 869 TaxID=2871694 RepID=UPI00210258BB|nr:helix-turn-helix domain-containing protein [Natrinema sp. SYSU A 869]